jgi:hypothetical protein
MSLISRLHQIRDEMLDDQEDPWKRVLERALPADLVCTSCKIADNSDPLRGIFASNSDPF